MSEAATRLIESVERDFGRFEESESTMTALVGAMALALNGKQYNHPGDAYAAGTIVQDKMSPAGRMRERAKDMMAEMLIAGVSPDALRF